MKKKYIQPSIEVIILNRITLLIGGSDPGSGTSGGGINPPGVQGSRRYSGFEEDEDDEEY